MTKRASFQQRLRRALLPAMLLTVLWLALWSKVSVLTVFFGLIVSTSILLLFPMPPLTAALRFKPLGAVRLLGHFLWSLVQSCAEVAYYACRPAGAPESVIVTVTMTCGHEVVMSIVASLECLLPGTTVVHLDPADKTMVLHGFVPTKETTGRSIAESCLALEARVLRAIEPVDHPCSDPKGAAL